MKKPEYVLETIHRNANTIAKFAHHIRQGKEPQGFELFDKMVSLGKKYTLPAAEGANFDQIICGYNKTRRDWNNRVRRIKKFENALSVKDKLICLKNNKDFSEKFKTDIINVSTLKKYLESDKFKYNFTDLLNELCTFVPSDILSLTIDETSSNILNNPVFDMTIKDSDIK